MSSQDDPAHGIGAAMRWIHDELQSYSPRLQVSYQPFKVRKAGAYAHDADLANVIAVQPGTTNSEISILVSGHSSAQTCKASESAPLGGFRLSGAETWIKRSSSMKRWQSDHPA